MSNSRSKLEEKARKALLHYAIFRWESAVLIALTLLLAAFAPAVVPAIPRWGWLLGGLIGEAALIYSSLTDPETGRQVIANMLRHEFHPERLSDRQLRQQVNEAFDYRGRIEAAIREKRDNVLKDNLSETARQIDEWLESIFSLAQRLDQYQNQQAILERDRQRAQKRIEELEEQLAEAQQEALQEQIQTNIKSLQRQITTIDTLESTMGRARLQLENTLSSLGTIFSQTMLVGARDIDSGRARRLRQEIADEVDELADILLAMEDVYAAQS